MARAVPEDQKFHELAAHTRANRLISKDKAPLILASKPDLDCQILSPLAAAAKIDA